MQYTMQIFEYEDNDQFRVIDREGEPWFVLTEVCKKIGIANPRDAASRLDDDEKDGVGISDAMGREQKTTVISEFRPLLSRAAFIQARSKAFQEMDHLRSPSEHSENWLLWWSRSCVYQALQRELEPGQRGSFLSDQRTGCQVVGTP